MRVTLAGAGMTGAELTPHVARVLERADVVVGARRLLDALPPTHAAIVEATSPQDVAKAVEGATDARDALVLLSGDTGFFSGATRLCEALAGRGHEVEVLPAVSSVQMLAARLRRPWHAWTLASAHGRTCDIMGLLRRGSPVFLLTSGGKTVRDICRKLHDAGLGTTRVTLAERLGYDDEHLREASATELMAGEFDALNVLLVEVPQEGVAPRRTPGIPDDCFSRGKVPMTKQEVRAAILAKLGVTDRDVCWDVGAGTGAVSVELALASKEAWAVENNKEALRLIHENRAKFRAWNMHVVAGTAPNALCDLPNPDVVFVGGSSGHLREILDEVFAANPRARVCVSAIALQTLEDALGWMDAHDMRPEVTQLAVSRTRRVGERHLLMANNPVFLVTGGTA